MKNTAGTDDLLAYVNALLDDPESASLDPDAFAPELYPLARRLVFLGDCVKGGRHLAESLTSGDLSALEAGGYDNQNPLIPSLETIQASLTNSVEAAQDALIGGLMAQNGQRLPGLEGIDSHDYANDYTKVLETAVTNLLEQQDSLVKTAFTDVLTGLGNRGGFTRSLDELWEAGQPVTMAFIDIDNLKHCNDTFGHDEGNRYILQVALYLKLYARENEAIFRIGGDEFVLLSINSTEEDLAERLEECRSVLLKNNVSEMPHTFSYGVSHANPALGDTSKRMTVDADRRMYEYKIKNAVHLPRAGATQADVNEALGERAFEAFSMLDQGRYLFIMDAESGYARWSLGAVRDLGLPSKRIESSAEVWKAHVHPDDVEAYEVETRKLLDGTKHHTAMQYRVKNAAGDYVLCRVRIYRIDGDERLPTILVGEVVNHTMAETVDFATGLGAQRMLVNAIEACRVAGRPTGLIAVRVRGTSALNEEYGYDAVDAMLAEYAGRLVSVARGHARVFRSRNAQFVVVTDDIDEEAFGTFAAQVESAVRKPATIAGEPISPVCLIARLHYRQIPTQANSVIAELDRRLRIEGGLVPSDDALPIPDSERKSIVSEHIDSLTGLYRSSEFMARSAEFLAAHGTERTFCFVTLDMGHMRLYNEWYGQEAGDMLLAQVGTHLKEIENEGVGVAGYWGQDDFCLIIPFERAYIEGLFAKVRDVVAEHDDSLGFLPSMGVCPVVPGTPVTIDLQAKAMFANKRAKRDFKDRIALFNAQEYECEVTQHRILTGFQYALSEGRITYYLQPQVDIETDAIVGAEALTRWIDTDGSIISPATFIPALEESGFIVTLDKHIWNEVARWMRARLDAGRAVVPISINVSRVDILTFDVASYIASIVCKNRLTPDLFKIEITETAYTGELKAVGDLTASLHENGFSTYMDDFGSGQSSLSMLKNVNVDVIKLDRSFIPSAHEGARGTRIMESMIDMATSLGLPVVVEGIETREQEELLRCMGGRYAQGFRFWKPMPVADFERLLDGSAHVDTAGIGSRAHES